MSDLYWRSGNSGATFRNCSKVQEVRRMINTWWRGLLGSEHDSHGTLDDDNGNGGKIRKIECAKEVVKHAYSWVIWKHRNKLVFNNTPFTPSVVANDIQAMSYFWFHNRSNYGKSVSWVGWCCSSSLL